MALDFHLWRMPSFAQLKRDNNITITAADDSQVGRLTYGEASLGVYEDSLDDDACAHILRYIGGSDKSVMEILWYLWETYGTLCFAENIHAPEELDAALNAISGQTDREQVIAEFCARCMLEMMGKDDPRRTRLEEILLTK